MKYLPFALPDIGAEEIADVVDALKSGWISTGPKAGVFEKDFLGMADQNHLSMMTKNKRSFMSFPEAFHLLFPGTTEKR